MMLLLVLYYASADPVLQDLKAELETVFML